VPVFVIWHGHSCVQLCIERFEIRVWHELYDVVNIALPARGVLGTWSWIPINRSPQRDLPSINQGLSPLTKILDINNLIKIRAIMESIPREWVIPGAPRYCNVNEDDFQSRQSRRREYCLIMCDTCIMVLTPLRYTAAIKRKFYQLLSIDITKSICVCTPRTAPGIDHLALPCRYIYPTLGMWYAGHRNLRVSSPKQNDRGLGGGSPRRHKELNLNANPETRKSKARPAVRAKTGLHDNQIQVSVEAEAEIKRQEYKWDRWNYRDGRDSFDGIHWDDN